MSVWIVLVAYLIEEVDLGLVEEERRGYAVYGRIAPSLVVESTSTIQVFEVLGVCFTSPEIHAGNLEVTPDYVGNSEQLRNDAALEDCDRRGQTHNDRGYTIHHRYRTCSA